MPEVQRLAKHFIVSRISVHALGNEVPIICTLQQERIAQFPTRGDISVEYEVGLGILDQHVVLGQTEPEVRSIAGQSRNVNRHPPVSIKAVAIKRFMNGEAR